MGTDRWVYAGERVREAREALGWSMSQLALEADLSVSVVQLVEKGRGEKCRSSTKRRLSVALGWTPESLEELGAHGREPVRAVAEPGR
jgi:ribosome-binding protein aMBF1 (putative translation factor)